MEPYILRDIDPIIGASLIGVGGSFLGGILGGNSQKKAAQQQAAQLERAAALEQAGILENRGNLASLLYGETEQGRQFLSDSLSREDYEKAFGRPARGSGFTAEQAAELRDIEAQIAAAQKSPRSRLLGGGTTGVSRPLAPNNRLKALEERRQQLLDYAEGDPGTEGTFSKSRFTSGREGLLAGYKRLGDSTRARGEGILAGFDDATRRGEREMGELVSSVDDYGRTEDARIDRDTNESLTQLNRRTSAALGRQGMLRSSKFGRQMATNTRYVTRDAQDRKDANADRRFGLRTSLEQGRVNANLTRANQRASLASGFSDQLYNLEREPLLLRERLETSPINTAKGNVNYAMYVPPTPSAGAMTGALGNVLSAQSGIMQGAFMDRALEQLYSSKPKSPNGTAAPDSARYVGDY
jgi:hypothetical protein